MYNSAMTLKGALTLLLIFLIYVRKKKIRPPCTELTLRSVKPLVNSYPNIKVTFFLLCEQDKRETN